MRNRSNAWVTGHHDDYSEPLTVRWLCYSCHRLHHLAVDGDARLRKPVPATIPDQGDLADDAYENYREQRDAPFQLPEYDTIEERRGDK